VISRRVQALEPSIIRDMFQRKRPTSLDLSLGEPSLPPEQEIMSRAWQVLQSGPQGYTLNAGLPELRTLIASHHALNGRDGPDNVIVTVGSEEAVFLAMLSLLDPSDEVLVPEPGYPAYRGIARLIGAVPVSYEIRRETGLVATARAIEAQITPRTKALVLNSPSNPFGTIDDPAELAQIAQLAERHGFTVISDEIYRDLYYGAGPPTSIAKLTDHALLVGGLSKSCALTGHRLGYLIGPDALMKKATLAHQLVVTCAPRLSQLAAIEVFRAPDLLRRHVPYYLSSRAAIEAARRQLPAEAALFIGEGAFYAILDVSHWANGDPLALALELLDREDVVAVPGTAFGPSGSWFFRLSYAAGSEAITEGLYRIGRFLRARPGRPAPAPTRAT
jgi:aminotransferase